MMRTTKSALRKPCRQAIWGDAVCAGKSSAKTGSWPNEVTAARAAARKGSIPTINELIKIFMAEGKKRKVGWEGEIKGVGYVARKPLSQFRFSLDTNLPWYPQTAAPSRIHCPFVVRTATRPLIANFSYPRAPVQPCISQPSSAPKPLTVTVHPQATGCLGGRASASVLRDNTRVNCAAPAASSRPRRRCATHTAPAPHRL